MFDHDDSYHDDPLATGRGIAYGLLFGTLMWAAIIGGILWLVYHT